MRCERRYMHGKKRRRSPLLDKTTKKVKAKMTSGVSYVKGFRHSLNEKSIFTFDKARDAFIPPQRFASWTLNESTCLWEPPVAYPDDGKEYHWNEATTSWKEIE